MTPADAIRDILDSRPRTPQSDSGWHYRPANVALAKYWGKRDAVLNLPVAASCSISMGQLGARTRITPAATDALVVDGNVQAPDSQAATRVSAWLDLFRSSACPAFAVESTNTVPVAAGLASSASGFAALAAAIAALFDWDLSLREESVLARLGSGSACRSHSPGFVFWHRGAATDGNDSWGEPIAADYADLRLAVVAVSVARKPMSSRQGMAHTIATSPLYEQWPQQAQSDAETMRDLILSGDFKALGQLAEDNAMLMHATMIAARPGLCYWLPESLAAMTKVRQLRDDGLPLYFTMDAGPNLKLLFESGNQAAVQSEFPNARPINPFEQ